MPQRDSAPRLRASEGPSHTHVLGVVLQCIAGLGVSEDGEAVAVDDQPGDGGGEPLGGKGQLTAAARMRADGLVVHAPDGHAERLAGRLAKGTRLLAAVAASK